MRPTTISEMRDAMQGFATARGVARGLAYQPDASDVFISPYAKCGTTWMQQIVHGLRTGGSMEFGEITEVVPWIEMAHDMGVDAFAPQVAHPRAFKSHLSWDRIPKGGQYIIVLRDPMDAMMSLYRFFDGWVFETGAISITEFATYYLDQRADDYWSHAASWWRQRGRADVLLLAFEDMKRDLRLSVDQVADFIGVTDPVARDIATRQAEFTFMKAHRNQFDDHLIRQSRDTACGLPPGGVAIKVRDGKTGAGGALAGRDLHARFAERWQDTMGVEFGIGNYRDLLDALRAQD